MIQLTPQMRILVAIQPVDFRKGINGLCSICREKIKIDPFNGYVFVFRNKKSTSIKLLVYDGQGFWLCQKRLSEGSFKYWVENYNYEKIQQMDVHELGLLLWNGNFKQAKCAPMWKRLPAQNKLIIPRHLRSIRSHGILDS